MSSSSSFVFTSYVYIVTLLKKMNNIKSDNLIQCVATHVHHSRFPEERDRNEDE